MDFQKQIEPYKPTITSIKIAFVVDIVYVDFIAASE